MNPEARLRRRYTGYHGEASGRALTGVLEFLTIRALRAALCSID